MRYYPEVKKAIGASEKIFEYLDRKPQVPPDGTLEPQILKGHIQFKKVTFSYSNGTENNTPLLKVCLIYVDYPLLLQLFVITYYPVLIHNIPLFYQDLSLDMKPSQITALVGLNRSGKSTCVKLLERFYQPQAGEILLDGKPLQSYKDQYLHKKVGG